MPRTRYNEINEGRSGLILDKLIRLINDEHISEIIAIFTIFRSTHRVKLFRIKHKVPSLEIEIWNLKFELQSVSCEPRSFTMVVWNLKSFKFDQCRREAFLHPSVWKLFRPMLLFIDSLHYFRAPFSKRTWLLLRAVTSHRSKVAFENVFLRTARYNQMTGNF